MSILIGCGVGGLEDMMFEDFLPLLLTLFFSREHVHILLIKNYAEK